MISADEDNNLKNDMLSKMLTTFGALVDLAPYGRPLAKQPPLPHPPALPPLPTQQKP